MEVKPLFSLLAAKAAIVNQLHGLSVCFASFHMVTPNGSSPAVANGVVYAGSNYTSIPCGSNGIVDTKFYAMDAVTGTLKWSYTTGGAINSSPAVVGGVVYVGSSDSKLYAMDAVTGTLKWSYATSGAIDSSPAVANGVVYAGSEDSKLYALDAANGTLKWSYVYGGGSSSPVVANSVVYVGSFSDYFSALDAVTGTLKWSFTTGIPISFSSPAVANGVVYVGITNGFNVYAFHLPGIS